MTGTAESLKIDTIVVTDTENPPTESKRGATPGKVTIETPNVRVWDYHITIPARVNSNLN